MSVHTANQTFLFNQAKQNDTKTSFVMTNVIGLLSKLLLIGNKMLTRVSAKKEKTSRFIIVITAKITQKIFNTLKQGDTQKKKEQKGRTPLKNGKNLKLRLGINVLCVARKNLSPKTISFLCLRVVQITYQTYNHCVAVVTAKNGQIDIHQHPQLLEQA